VARVRAALRRHEAPEPFVVGDLAINFDRSRVTVAGEVVVPTATAYELLRELALDAGRVLAYETLLRRVWGPRDGEDAASPAWNVNERGVGYRMADPGAD